MILFIFLLMNIQETNFFKAVKTQLEQKLNATLLRKLEEFKIQLLTVLTPEEKARIDITELFSQVSFPIRVNLCTYQVKKNRQRNKVSDDHRCLARIGLGKQCSRSRIKNCDYCKSHSLSLPYGRIDGPLEGKLLEIGKKKGRKPKEKEFTLDDLDLSKYIQAMMITIDGATLVQDENGVLYTYDAENKIVGRAMEDEIEWY